MQEEVDHKGLWGFTLMNKTPTKKKTRRSGSRRQLLWAFVLLVTLSVQGLLPAVAGASGFTDVDAVEVTRLTEDGIVSGMTETSFAPDENVTRAQAAVMIGRALGLSDASADHGFHDVPAGHFAEGYITSARENGTIGGGTDGRFRPDDSLTRAEMAAILTRSFTYDRARVLSFSDVSASSIFYANILTLAQGGITAGYPDGTFRPDRTISRLEFSLMLARTLYPEYRPAVGQPESDVDSVVAEAARVTATSLNIRPTPSTDLDPIGRLLQNTVIDVTERTGNWAKVSVDGITGYVSMSFLDFDLTGSETSPSPEVRPPETVPAPSPGGEELYKVVRTPTLNVRPTPSTTYGRIATLHEHERVTVHETTGNWARISNDRVQGYASLWYLTRHHTSEANRLNGRTIVVDAGHGGQDPGAVHNGLREKDIVLDVSLRLEAKLKAAGANVIMTRRGDTFPTLSERAALANRSNADIFVSVHTNAAGSPAARGSETFYFTSHAAADSRKLAESLQKHMLRELNTVNRGVKIGNFHVLRNTTMPSALVELGFKTNPQEVERMKTNAFREASADALYKGIIEFYETR